MVYKKNPKIAFALSICPGAGYLYLQSKTKAFAIMIVTLLLFVVKSKIPYPILIYLSLLGLIGITAYDAYKMALDTRKNKRVDKDPYLAMCYSLIYDGFGQYYNKNIKRGAIFSVLGLNSCLICWYSVLLLIPVNKVLSTSSGRIGLISNILFVWSFVAVIIKAFSMIDAYFTTYHKYILKVKK